MYGRSNGANASQRRAQQAYGLANETIPPVQQIVMLYEGAIKRVLEARDADREGRIEDRFNASQKAAKILDGLHSCLDVERGGEIAANLDRLYRYFNSRIQQANVTRDPAIFEEVATRLTELKRSWEQIAANGGAPDDPARDATPIDAASLSA